MMALITGTREFAESRCGFTQRSSNVTVVEVQSYRGEAMLSQTIARLEHGFGAPHRRMKD